MNCRVQTRSTIPAKAHPPYHLQKSILHEMPSTDESRGKQLTKWLNKLTVKRHKIFWSFAKLYTIQLEGVIQFYWRYLVWREISAGRPAAAYISCMLCVLHAHTHTHTHTHTLHSFGAQVTHQSALALSHTHTHWQHSCRSFGAEVKYQSATCLSWFQYSSDSKVTLDM